MTLKFSNQARKKLLPRVGEAGRGQLASCTDACEVQDSETISQWNLNVSLRHDSYST